MDFALAWYILLCVLFIGYVVLDGFDLGVGIQHLFARDEEERRTALNAIGPVWDGNEVWLITAGGALFAAFPPVYAALTSGAYTAVVLFLLTLIFRAVSVEFRGKIDSANWRKFWDTSFGISSLLAALLLGVAMGNIVQGFALTGAGVIEGGLLGLLNLPGLIMGILTVVWLTLHGSAYLMVKSDRGLGRRCAGYIRPLGFGALVLIVFLAADAVMNNWLLVSSALTRPLAWVFGTLALVSLVILFFGSGQKKAGLVFLASAGFIVSGLAFCGSALYPNLLFSKISSEFSLTVVNGSSSPYTLQTMFIIACIGVPVVLLYTAYVYWVFKGKVDQNGEVY